MGLDDLIPDEVDESTSRAPQTREKDGSDEEDSDIVKKIGSPPHDKSFNQDQWDRVKRVIHEEFGMKVGEVLSSPPRERYELLHEAVTMPESEIGEGESDHSSSTRCAYCGKSCDGANVEIGGKKFCVHHTVAQAEKELK